MKFEQIYDDIRRMRKRWYSNKFFRRFSSDDSHLMIHSVYILQPPETEKHRSVGTIKHATFYQAWKEYDIRDGSNVCIYGTYRQISNISRTKSQYWNVSRLVLQLSLPNPLKPGVKSIMKM